MNVPPKRPKNPPTMVNFRVVFAQMTLDLPARAIYKLLVWSVRNVRLTSLTIQTSAQAAARRSKTEMALSRTCGGITNQAF